MRLRLCISTFLLARLCASTLLAAEPIVHMLVPGFTVRELPVKLNNVNNLRFAPDGRLTALGYDGRIWLLRDTNGDGLEDTAESFWDKPTLSVPVGIAWSTRGLLVSSHGKVSLLRDTDGDGQADTEEIIASGWPETDVGSGGVDATAVTLDKEGNVYFGLLVADYSNAYRLRKRKDLKPEEKAWLAAKAAAASPSPAPRSEVRGRENSQKNVPTPETSKPAGDGRARRSARDEATSESPERRARSDAPHLETNAEGLDPEEEVSLYDLNSPRGTIQKWNARTKKLETIATGIRVPYTLAFNKAGDLFNTDQEGETWMPNGNPLDELNHIIPGRNYGFPPRHPKWLPDLISEPPVVAFGPQHESTCGLIFNEPHAALNSKFKIQNSKLPALPASPAQGLFGPKWWEGDAFVAGESRGKIWRVRLVKTPHGYLGKEYLIARLSMLTTDLAISPRGELYVSCHSGGPDWGTGPNGPGKIFKITYTDPQAPQPVIAWAAGPTEVRVAFDKPLDASVTNAIMSTTSSKAIEYGEFVRAADRYEVLKPPYKVVQQQEAAPRGKLNILGARLEDNGQTLALQTEPHPAAVNYALTIPGVKANGNEVQGTTVDVDYDFSGVWSAVIEINPLYSVPGVRILAQGAGIPRHEFLFLGWLPFADIQIAARFGSPSLHFSNAVREFKEGNANKFFSAFRPNIQTDYVTLHFRAQREFELDTGSRNLKPQRSKAGWFEINWNSKDDPSDASLRVFSNKRVVPFSVTATVGSNPLEKPLSIGQCLLPWAPTNPIPGIVTARKSDFAVGDWQHGRELFFSEQVQCAKCHRVRGEGATVGPDLSNLIHRDAASVLRDIREPSAAINPDYVTYNVTRLDGESFTGFIRANDRDALWVIGADGKEVVVPRAELKDFSPSQISLMPAGLLDTLKESDVKDLLTFLLHAPPERTRDDLRSAGILPAAASTATGALENPKRLGIDASAAARMAALPNSLRLVLVASKQDHGPGQHDYPAWQKKWSRLLASASANVTVTEAWEWPTPEQFQTADVLVFYFWNHDWSAERYRQLDEFLARGGGVVLLHSATIADKDPEQLAERIGLAAQPQRTKYIHAPFDLKIVAPEGNAITRGLPKQIAFLDEPYWPMIGDAKNVEVLATTEQDGQSWPMMWTFQKGKGRVFASILGHYTWTHDDPFFRLLILRGISWAAGAEPERLAGAVVDPVVQANR